MESMADMLPNEARRRIARFLSTKPYSMHWQKFVSAVDVLYLAHAKGPWPESARAEFSVLESKYRDDNDVSKEGVRLFDSYDTSTALESLVPVLGSGLTTLNFRNFRLSRSCAPVIALHCQGLRHLSLCCDNGWGLTSLLTKRGASLEVLELRVNVLSVQRTAAIAANCRRLRRLRLRVRRYVTSLAEVWKGVGPTLRTLEFGSFYGDGPVAHMAAADAVRECVNVSGLAFQNFFWPDNGGVIENLCCSFGSNLERLDLSAFNTRVPIAALRKIAAECPNAEILCPTDPETTIAMGARASSVVMRKKRGGREVLLSNIANVGRECPNLKSIKIEGVDISADVFQSFFATPKLQLERFEFRPKFRHKSNESLWRILGEQARTLEFLNVTGSTPPIRLVESFVAANQHLKKVQLGIWNRRCMCCDDDGQSEHEQDDPPESYARLVSTFLRCPKLIELEIECRHPTGYHCWEIGEACLPARFRDISISVCQYQYK